MEDRDILLGRIRGAIHAHQKYTAAPAIQQDDWTDTALPCKSAVQLALLTFVSIIPLVSPKWLDDWSL